VEGLNVSEDDDHFYTTTDVAAALLKQLCGESLAQRDDIQEVVPYEDFAKRARNRELNGGTPPPNTRNHGKNVEAGMQRLFLNVGIKDHMRPNQIVQFIASNGEIPGKDIGAIAIFDEYTFVDVPVGVADQVVSKTNKEKIGRTVVNVELKNDSQGTAGSAPAPRTPYGKKRTEEYRSEPRRYDDKKRPEAKKYDDKKPSEPRKYDDKKKVESTDKPRERKKRKEY
jgi:hypothetical protein